MLAPGGIRYRRKIDRKIFNLPADRALDVGCGPDSISPDPTGILVGIDVNPSYIRAFTGGFIDEDPQLIFHPPSFRKRLGYVVSSDHLPFPDESFNEVRTSSFFHHVTDEEAEKAIREMVRCTQPGGRLIMFDAVWPKNIWTRPLAYLILKCDRGQHMRSEEQFMKLFQKASPGEWTCFRFTYTYTGMEMVCLQLTKR